MEFHIVEAPTAADAITIAQVRYNFPLFEEKDWRQHARKLKDIREATTEDLINYENVSIGFAGGRR